LKRVRQIGPFEILQNHVWEPAKTDIDIDDPCHVLAANPGRRSPLVQEARNRRTGFALLEAQKLDGDPLAKRGVLRGENHTHPTRANSTLHPVLSGDDLAGRGKLRHGSSRQSPARDPQPIVRPHELTPN
jgi:hypothetical protein